ncbi:MAG: hypothetical protein COY58_07220 [Gammaproteobacteria bacterium CG_4_10_14_0_8_um_filter_38_16]|nr:MAG: hypothetical protein COY58_07220 [Gammaproteobacteria bacterium CG_4_10_14_0_8_um_filter_38_16]PJA04008.1 MAG: hypothetical protein COX72_02085 [Gammaproteobacteria bacterium CG_4_10_14_0_2_um_filter_38_22]PJB11020.1 MAG: hypothetical protein CO120_01860 [Gammaproteobacteria bacterium CG_4_9_14_3_um_filter_38_9]
MRTEAKRAEITASELLMLILSVDNISSDDYEKIYAQRIYIEKIIAALSLHEKKHKESPAILADLVKRLSQLQTRGAFSEEEWKKALSDIDEDSPQPSTMTLNLNGEGSLNADPMSGEAFPLLLPLSTKRSPADHFIHYVSRGQQVRSLLTRLYHAVTDFLLAFPRENFSVIAGNINLALLVLACLLPAIRLTATLFVIAKYALNYNDKMSDKEKALPATLKLKDQLARNWPMLSQDFVWPILRGAACMRQDYATLFTVSLFSFLLTRNIIVDHLNYNTYEKMIERMDGKTVIQKALRDSQREVRSQDSIALGVAGFYVLGAALAMIAYFETSETALLLPIGGTVIGLTAALNFIYEMWIKQSVIKLTLNEHAADAHITISIEESDTRMATPTPEANALTILNEETTACTTITTEASDEGIAIEAEAMTSIKKVNAFILKKIEQVKQLELAEDQKRSEIQAEETISVSATCSHPSFFNMQNNQTKTAAEKCAVAIAKAPAETCIVNIAA